MNTESMVIDLISVENRLREVDPEAVEAIAKSMAEIGLLQPITTHTPDDGTTLNLVAGAHRLAAAKSLGWEEIDTFVMEGDILDCQLAEIAENLHRADLTVAQRSEQVARWMRIVEEKQERDRKAAEAEDGQPDQVEQAVLSDGRKAGPQHQESGASAASRELGIDRNQARRAKLIASIPPEAKKAAKDAGLDDNQSALERIAKADDKMAEVEAIAKERAEREAQKEKERQEDEAERAERKRKKEFNALVNAWTKARPSVREEFLDYLDEKP